MKHEELVEIIQQCTQELFATMLGTQITLGQTYYGEEPAAPTEGVLALVGLAGTWAGTGMVCSRAETARAMSALMLMQDFATVDDEVLDAVGEVTNMIFGNVKTALEDKLGPMGLSIPTVIYGRNFNARTLGKKEWTVVTFSWPGQEFAVHLCLTMTPKDTMHTRPAAGVALI